ncbi:MAG: YggS family pyridoxal phosphate-dependent enzyme [Phototrophicales bacterium]|nr:MAG: YggS family pyridoxal phosphate-dependent enzyme [Phototrophicales bacterium]
MISPSQIVDNLARVQEQIAAACARAGRDPASVKLIAVSKTHPVEPILVALEAGVQHLGENRVEEAESKIPAVDARAAHRATWHMIGHLQSRKAKDAVPLFPVIHSVDTVKLAGKLSRAAVEAGRTVDIFLEVNVSGEASKAGFNAHDWQTNPARLEQLQADFLTIDALPGLRLRGLMTMAPIVERMEDARSVFASLAALRSALVESTGIPLPDLSMGMTDDYPVAVEEGATWVRVGRAIFGERQV